MTGGINIGRWLLGGLIAGIFILFVEGLASTLYIEDVTAAMKAHNLSMEVSPASMVVFALVSLVTGLVLVFFYTAVRTRFGPGPGTAVVVAFALWTGGYLLALIGYGSMGLFPRGLLFMWGVVGLLEMIAASILGDWIYREHEQRHSQGME